MRLDLFYIEVPNVPNESNWVITQFMVVEDFLMRSTNSWFVVYYL